MVDQPVFAIVGAGLTGAKAAEGLREAGFTGRIVLIGQETERPYERPPLSKGYLLGKDEREKAYVHGPDWYAEQDVELLLGVRVTGLDAAARRLSMDGHEPLHYDRLLLATGSRPRRLDVPGADLAGVRYLRELPDSDALRDELPAARRVVVVGAGWIGLETTAAAREHGCDVTVVELDRAPLRRVLGDELAAVFRRVHEAHGVSFRFGVRVAEFRGDDGTLRSVVLSDGTELPADLAVVGVGITPATELAEAAGLTVDGGVVTDDELRTSDPAIYAAGDVANSRHPLLQDWIRVEHWANALNGGKAVAASMLDRSMTYDRIPYFFSDQYTSSPSIGMEYAGFGNPDREDQVVFRGDPTVRPDADPEFVAFWVHKGQVMAGMNVNVWDVQDDIQHLVRAGFDGGAGTVDVARLADPAVPLSEVLG